MLPLGHVAHRDDAHRLLSHVAMLGVQLRAKARPFLADGGDDVVAFDLPGDASGGRCEVRGGDPAPERIWPEPLGMTIAEPPGYALIGGPLVP